MRILALAAAASMSLAPAVTMADDICPVNSELVGGACQCAEGFVLGAAGACIPTAGSSGVAGGVEAGETANLPILSKIPKEALIIGGLVILAGVIIGIAAASNGKSNGAGSTTGTNAVAVD